MTSRTTRTLTAAGATLALAVTALGTANAAPRTGDAHHHHDTLTQVAPLDGPRGVDAVRDHKILVTEGDGSFSLVVDHDGQPATVIELGTLGGGFPPAIAAGRHGTVWLLTGGGPPPEEERRLLRGPTTAEPPGANATLFKWRRGFDAPQPVADIAAYQATDPDPFDQEGAPEDSNPFGLAALGDGSVLVADAAGNDLLRVWGDGTIKTVARLKPRVVEVPEGLPDVPPEEGGPLPPAGTPITSEAVATSVTVGWDGYWYVGELRGFPATPRTSQIWRIRPGTYDATCDPEHPWRGRCKRFIDGLTSIMDLSPAHEGVLAVELSKKSWLQWELGVSGGEVGGLFHVKRRHLGHPRIHELVPGQLILPAGVDADQHDIYVTSPLFGPGALWRVD